MMAYNFDIHLKLIPISSSCKGFAYRCLVAKVVNDYQMLGVQENMVQSSWSWKFMASGIFYLFKIAEAVSDRASDGPQSVVCATRSRIMS